MGGFGQHLVERGVLSDVQLEEALRFQQVYGGRIGTVAVDLGYLVVEELAEYLSDYSGVPLPPPDWLDAPDPQALKNVPPPVVRRCQALPLSLEGGALHVVMLDPCDPEKLDFLAMAASRPVVPYVLPERKLLYWLEVHCGLDRPPRFLGMLTRPRQIGLTEEEVASGTPMLDNRERMEARAAAAGTPREASGPHDTPEGEQVPLVASHVDASAMAAAKKEDQAGATHAALPPLAPPSDAAPRPTQLAPLSSSTSAEAEEEDDEIILLDELVAESEASVQPWELPKEFGEVESAPGEHAAPSEPISIRLARLEAKLYQSCNRDEVMGLALEIARSYSAASALFVVRGEEVSLFRTSIPGAHPDALELSVPIQTPSVFTQPAQTGLPFRGQHPDGGIDARVLEGLGRGGVSEILVHPVVIRDRVVNVLYADNGPEPFGETSIGALTALCHTLSMAYERLIAEQKQSRGA